jgi:hypothetical protein
VENFARLRNISATRSKCLMDKWRTSLVHRLYRGTSTAAVENPIAQTTMPPEGGIASLQQA